jgi:hypothetical protein
MGWGEAIKAFLITIPKLLDLFSRLGKQMAEKSFQDWLAELDQTTQNLENAKTMQERVDAAKKLSDLIRRS